MKQKRTFIAVLLVIAVLALGVAFAAINQIDLTLTGNVQALASDNNFKVVMKSAGTPDVSGVAEVPANITQVIDSSVSGLTATLNAKGLTTEGDKVTYTFVIENQSDEFAADLAIADGDAEFTTASGLFKVTASLAEAQIAAANDGDTDETTLTVVVELLSTPKADQAAETIEVVVEATVA